MPHVIVKLWPGRSEEQKNALTDMITNALKETMDASDSSISIAIEEIPKKEWKYKVYDPEIMARKDILYKGPGYNMTE